MKCGLAAWCTAGALLAADHDLRPDVGDGLGWPGHVLANEVAAIAVAPRQGGRLVGWKLGGRQLLYTDPAWHGRELPAQPGGNSFWEHAAFGGMRSMPAPQSQWKVADAPIPAWPPPPALDHGIYASSAGPTEVHTHGPVEDNQLFACVGMQLRYLWKLQPGSSRVLVETRLTNFARHPQTWGLWAVAQLHAPRGGEPIEAFWPMRSSGASRFGPDGYIDQGGTREDGQVAADQQRRQVTVRDRAISRKVSGDTDGGWVALWRPDAGVVAALRFDHDAAAWSRMAYPEGGSTVAVAILSDRPVIELEAMSPVVHLDPGEAVIARSELAACRVDARPLTMRPWGAVVEPLRVVAGRLRAEMGFFDQGELVLRQPDGQEQRLAVTPLTPLSLNLPWTGPPPEPLLRTGAGGAQPIDATSAP